MVLSIDNTSVLILLFQANLAFLMVCEVLCLFPNSSSCSVELELIYSAQRNRETRSCQGNGDAAGAQFKPPSSPALHRRMKSEPVKVGVRHLHPSIANNNCLLWYHNARHD